MNVYFVRHGQTHANASIQFHTPDETLSEEGFNQAKTIALQFEQIPFTKLISSPYKRALDTAKEISKITNISIDESNLFIERKRPSEIYHFDRNEKDAANIEKQIHDHYTDTLWHYSDEENFIDLETRALNAKSYLENLSENTVIVSHSTFLKMLILVLTFGVLVTPELFLTFDEHAWYANTAVTVFDYSNDEWHLVTFGEKKLY